MMRQRTAARARYHKSLTVLPVSTPHMICHHCSMIILRTCLCLLILCVPASAGQSMSAEAFNQYTLGKTLIYGQDGAAYGVEEYLENRRVRWSFLDGQCKEGLWYPQDGQICFVYEDNPEPQCWTFTLGAGGLIAQFEDEPDGLALYEADEADKPMLCYGPDVGV
jgi:hypothetical protein